MDTNKHIFQYFLSDLISVFTYLSFFFLIKWTKNMQSWKYVFILLNKLSQEQLLNNSTFFKCQKEKTEKRYVLKTPF